MAMTFDEKLQRLKNRRIDTRGEVALQMQESYEKRSPNSATKYALGGMQEVNPRSTEISVEEAKKVKRNLQEGLKDVSLKPEFKLQGSVPINVHIRGASDVDLLVIDGKYVRTAPCLDGMKTYGAYDGLGSIDQDVLHLRQQSELVLERRFHGATIDKSNAKSIELSEGAFRRKVDVVPSCWYDSAEFQRTLDERLRAVEILDKYSMTLIKNFPFLYMHEIDQKGLSTNGGSKMAIRLAKNVKNDSDAEIELSSYDIGSLCIIVQTEICSVLPQGICKFSQV